MKSLLTATAFALAIATSSSLKAAQDDDPEVAAALAQIEAALPGELIANPLTTVWRTVGKDQSNRIVRSDDIPGGSAYRVEVKKATPQPWEVSVKVAVEEPINAGDTIEVAAWVRAAEPAADTDTGKVGLAIGRTVQPWDSVLNTSIRPTSQWRMYSARGTAKSDFPVGQATFNANLGEAEQTIEFGPVYMVRLNSAAAAASAQASAAGPAPDSVQPAPPVERDEASASGTFVSARGNTQQSAVVSGAGLDGADAFQLVVASKPEKSWDAAAGTSALPVAIGEGQQIVVRVWARSVGGPGRIAVRVEGARPPHQRVIGRPFDLTEEWAQFVVRGRSPFALGAGEAWIAAHVGHMAQTVQFGGWDIRVTD